MRTKHRSSLPLLLCLSLLLVSCAVEGGPPDSSVLPTESPTSADPTAKPSPEPTQVPPPTETPEEVPTEATDGTFRDDFEADLGESWLWINEDPSRWQITDNGWLQLTAGDPPIAPETTEIPMVNLLTRPLPQGVDISVTTHLVANPDENFEQATLFLIEDGDSYVLANLGFCAFCTQKSIYLEAYADGQSLLEGLHSFPLPEDQTEVWLRLEYNPDGNAVVAMVALEEGEWQRVGSIVRDPPAIGMVAIGAANVPGPGANPGDDLIAMFDYLEIEVFD